MKLSFEDISKIYRFMDTDGDGEIGFDEFTFLSEERWKSVDAYAQYLEGVNGRELNNAKRDDLTSIASQKSTAKLGSRIDDAEGYAKLEDLSREHLKIPIRKNEKTGFVNINRNDTSNFFERQQEFTIHGKPTEPNGKINSVLRHDYLRKSIVDRIERKNLVKHYRMS